MTTEYGDISPRVAAYAAVKMLEHAEPVIVIGKFGDMKPQPKNKSDQVKFRRPVPFGAVTTPLVEGITPSAQAFSYEDVSCTLLQWGAYTEITDKVEDLHEDPVLMNMSELSGEQAAETMESVAYGVIKGGTNVIYANGSARTDVNSILTKSKLHAAVRALKAQRGKKMTSMLDGSTNFSTKPIESSYIAFCHTDCDYDIRALPGFTPLSEYGSRQPLCPEELGSVEDVRFVTSPMLDSFADAGGTASTNSTKSTTGTSSDVYPIIVVAKHAYGHVPLKGSKAIKPMVLNPNTPRGGDPLGQKGSVAWKAWYNAVILNQAWMQRIEVAVTDL